MSVITVTQLNAWVKASPVGVRRYRVEPNLYLEVRRKDPQSASASWVFRWRVEGKDQSVGLGSYIPTRPAAKVVTLAKAREAAERYHVQMEAGNADIAAERRAARLEAQNREAAALAVRREREATAAKEAAKAVQTVQAACDEWHNKTAPKLSSPKYAAQRLRRLQDFYPHVGAVPVADLEAKQVSNAFDAMLLKVANRGQGHSGAETLRRSSADLEKAWAYAAGKGWCKGSNPVTTARTNLDKPKATGRRMFDAARLPEFWAALDAVEAAQRADGRRYPVTVQLLRMLTLTAARTLEVRGLHWSEVEDLDGEAPTIRVPEGRMKRRTEWTIPLSPAAVELLRAVRAWQAEAGAGLKGVKAGLVFVHLEGNYKGRGLSENAANDLLQEMKWTDADGKERAWADDLTAHGLRKVFSTVAHDQWPYHGPNRTEAIEYSLAHAPADKVRGTYDKNDFTDKRRALLTWWADHLDKVLTEAKKEAVSDVNVDEGFESAVRPLQLRRVK